MRDPKILLFIFGLFVQTCLSEKVETPKHGHNTDGKDKKVSKRDYYAPEYNHDKHNSYPAYRFEYGVHDPQTGDIKKQYEERDGDTVRGYYSLMEPDGSIRLVEYTADSKNGFQATVKKMGHSHHPNSVTYHMNAAAGLHHQQGDGGGSYAPNYHGGDHYDHQQLTFAPVYGNDNGHHYQQQPAGDHYGPPPQPTYDGHYEPPHNFDNHYYLQQQNQHQQQPPPPSAYDHYEPPLVPAHNHYQQPPPSGHSDHYERPAVPAVQEPHYQPVAAGPETVDFEPGPQPLFAGGLPTAHGDYGSASPEQYYPSQLQFPAASRENVFDEWTALGDDDHLRSHRVDLDGFQFPAAVPARGVSAERPEYLRKYFEPDYRGNAAAHGSYEDDGDQSK